MESNEILFSSEWQVRRRIGMLNVCWRCGPKHWSSILEFYSEASVQESTIYLKCATHTQKPWATHLVVSPHPVFVLSLSLYLQYVCLSMFTKTFLCPSGSCREETGRLELQEENRPHYFFTALMESNRAFDRDCCTAGMLVCTHVSCVWVCF